MEKAAVAHLAQRGVESSRVASLTTLRLLSAAPLLGRVLFVLAPTWLHQTQEGTLGAPGQPLWFDGATNKRASLAPGW